MGINRLSGLALGVATVVAGASVGISAGSAQAVTAPPRPVLPSVTPRWAVNALAGTATPAADRVTVALSLTPKDPAGYASFVNPLAERPALLSSAEVKSRYGSPTAVAAVTSWLQKIGATDIAVDQDDLRVAANLTAGTAATAFGVRFRQQAHGGPSRRVAFGQPGLPAAIAPLVTVVSGLTEEVATPGLVNGSTTAGPATDDPTGGAEPAGGPSVGDEAPPPAFYVAQPCSQSYYGQDQATDQPSYPRLPGDTSTTKPYVTCGYTPLQVRSAYGVNQVPYTGRGVIVGINGIDDPAQILQDAQTESDEYGLPTLHLVDISPAALRNSPTGDADAQAGYAQEEALDIESVHAMAPDATIVYSGAGLPNDGGLDQATINAIEYGAEEISSSFSFSPDPDDQSLMASFAQVTTIADMMGAGLNYDTGDSADHVVSSGRRAVDFPTDNPLVTGVGGTTLEIGPTGTSMGETYWGGYRELKSSDGTSWQAPSTYSSGGGGGVANDYAEPSYQMGVVPARLTQNSDSGTTEPSRVVPDVSMLGDPNTGMLIGITQTADGGPASGTPTYGEVRFGGTSLSTPLFAGIMALVVQAVGHPIGLANPYLYGIRDGGLRDPSIGRAPGASRLGGTVASPDTDPVLAEVREDHADPSDPTSATTASLRLQGVLTTLNDLPGYDDSTGLGSPYAPVFIADFQAALPPTAALPEAADPVSLVLVGLLGVLGLIGFRRRRGVAS